MKSFVVEARISSVSAFVERMAGCPMGAIATATCERSRTGPRRATAASRSERVISRTGREAFSFPGFAIFLVDAASTGLQKAANTITLAAATHVRLRLRPSVVTGTDCKGRRP